jgi:hydrophobe/amphiphile efflux-1 (HAE1) family protein
MSRFFIHRPIFACVIAIVIMIAGALSISRLPIAQYPSVSAPSVNVSASYPGASAKTVEDTVTQVIEQNLSGIDNLRYIESQSGAGSASITVTFNTGTNADTAQVQVQNKVALASAQLPQEVQQQGVQVTKSRSNFLLVIGLISEDGSMSAADLGDYAMSTLHDPLSRVNGGGSIQTFGTKYAMRIWLDPDKLTKYQLSTSDVVNAVKAQNAQVSAGSLGATPAVKGQLLNATIMAQSRLQTVDEFAGILLRVNTDGSRVFLRDVARVELGSESYDTLSRYNGKPAAGMAVMASSDANALATVTAVKKKIEELSATFPAGVKVVYPYDTTPFVRLSIYEVVKTLVEAIVLVFLVMYLFLQNWRATLIPTITIPVVLLGTFGVMAVFGFSINTLTLFAMVLAIGLLVDDAIVVVENVERVMEEEGLPPRDAALKSMGQISGALIGIGLVLCAAFVPMAFFGGSTGVIYRQFSIVIATAVALSVLVALIITPALCATLLKPIPKGHHITKRGFFGWFNRFYARTADRYAGSVGTFLRRTGRALLFYAIIAGAVVFMFMRLPKGFLPQEDQGVLFVTAQLPPGSTQEQSLTVLEKIEQHFINNEKESVNGVFGIVGFSFNGSAQNQVMTFVNLKSWGERKTSKQRVSAIQGRAMRALAQLREATAFALVPPAIPELGTSSGFDLRLVDQTGIGHEALMNARNQLLGMAAQDPVLMAVRPTGLDDQPEYHIRIDQEKATALGLSLSDINSSLSTIWGSAYVNDFIDKGRVKRVIVQGDAPFRMLPEDVNRWYVRSSGANTKTDTSSGSGGTNAGANNMVPFSAFSTASWTVGAPSLSRFNGSPSVSVSGQAAQGKSTGQAMSEIEKLAKSLPAGTAIEWGGISYEERLAGSQSAQLYLLALLVVFLSLAALYESWAIPFAVMMDMPLGALGVLAATSLRGMSNDVYFQIGFITIIGLSAKNAILVIEFARERFNAGATLIEAALEAVRTRLRPVMMTSIAFGLGVLPLAISTGAGSGSQNEIGTGILGGTITTTLLGLFFVPLYFVVIMRLFRVKPQRSLTGEDKAQNAAEKAANLEAAPT